MHTNQEVDNVGDVNLVEIWLKKDPKRWIAGILGGAFAAIVATVFAAILSKSFGHEVTFPVKVFALLSLGSSATEFAAGTGTLIVGLVTLTLFGAFWGALYAHFTGTNKLGALLGMGFVWGAFLWIFWFCLFFFSFKAFLWAQVSPAGTFPVAMVYGLSLSSVRVFDQMLRR